MDMALIRKFWPCLIIAFCLNVGSVFAQNRFAAISLDNSSLPSDDLLYQNRVLRSDEARDLALKGVDLSSLDPVSNLFWSNSAKAISVDDQDIDVNSLDEVQYRNAITSVTGLFRFNVQKGNTTAIVHMDKTLHTILLRKNILRLLGYNVPSIKWLPKLRLKFQDLGEMKLFLESEVSRFAEGAACRWVDTIHFQNEEELKKFAETELHKATIDSDCTWELKVDSSAYEVVLEDIAITIPRSGDYFNLAMGTPPQNLTNRTWRAAIIPYALASLDESVNAFDWNVGRIYDGQILLPHFTYSDFSTSMDDARWMLNRLKKISREQLSAAVKDAHFPDEVGTLLLEKLIARRNSLMDLFKIKTSEISYDPKPGMGKLLAKGKLQKQYWPGYASRFAWGDPDSPLKKYHWYALAKIQAVVIDNLVALGNDQIMSLNPDTRRQEFIYDQFMKGLQHFIQTGEFMVFPVKTWFSPMGDVNLKASRDVVVGNYLGTDNMVQVADTLGWSVRLGARMGIENVPNIPTISAESKVTISKSWAHLKPLRNLKDAMNPYKNPYRNIAVPMLKWHLKRDLQDIADLKNSKNPQDIDLKKKDSQLNELVKLLNNTLGIGESLLFTETVSPDIKASANTGEVFPVIVKAQASANVNVTRRIQIYRKDSKTIQVYDDGGNSRGWSFDVALQKFVPIVQLGVSKSKGDYRIRLYDVNINPDVSENPTLYDQVHALATFIHHGSSELLASLQKPNKLDADFEDKSTRFALLAWRLKKLKTTTELDVSTRDGLKGKFIAFTDEKQTGWNWEAFSRDLINFAMAKYLKDTLGEAQWSGSGFQNPAETIMGVGYTHSVRFEASVDDNHELEERFMRLTDKWHGWSASVGKVKKHMEKINEKFGGTIFDEGSLGNMNKLKLFDVSVNLNLYEAGIARLEEIPLDQIYLLEEKYEVAKEMNITGCNGEIVVRKLSSGKSFETCGILSKVANQLRQCQANIHKKKPDSKINKCLTQLFRVAYETIEYADLERFIGKENIFVYGSINGFRNGDEILNDPITSNTEGRIQSEFWNGPFEVVQRLMGISGGEFSGYWLRERL
jgi:hypothetical protein